MTRLPSSKDMSLITAITCAREQAALARISKAAACRDRAAEAVARLLAINPQAKSLIEAELISNWLVWKQSELRKRNIALAAAEAEYQKVVRQSGRHIAEHAVTTELLAQAKTEASRIRNERDSVTFLDEQSR